MAASSLNSLQSRLLLYLLIGFYSLLGSFYLSEDYLHCRRVTFTINVRLGRYYILRDSLIYIYIYNQSNNRNATLPYSNFYLSIFVNIQNITDKFPHDCLTSPCTTPIEILIHSIFASVALYPKQAYLKIGEQY
jgi:hypothetical protein